MGVGQIWFSVFSCHFADHWLYYYIVSTTQIKNVVCTHRAKLYCVTEAGRQVAIINKGGKSQSIQGREDSYNTTYYSNLYFKNNIYVPVLTEDISL